MRKIRNIKFTPTADFTQALLHEYLHYNPETGWLIWKKSPAQAVVVGARAGSLDAATDGYRRIRLKDHHLLEHRVIWFYVHGIWPKNRQLDHINRVRDDNRLANLRLGTVSQNQVNRNQYNILGTRNVYRQKSGRFAVYMSLGTYDTQAEAAQVAYEASKKLHGEFVRSEDYGLVNYEKYKLVNSEYP